jgi:hypothetical protein
MLSRVSHKIAVCCSMVMWYGVACCLCVHIVTVSHTGTNGFYILVEFCWAFAYLPSFFPHWHLPHHINPTGATASCCFAYSPGPCPVVSRGNTLHILLLVYQSMHHHIPEDCNLAIVFVVVLIFQTLHVWSWLFPFTVRCTRRYY